MLVPQPLPLQGAALSNYAATVEPDCVTPPIDVERLEQPPPSAQAEVASHTEEFQEQPPLPAQAEVRLASRTEEFQEALAVSAVVEENIAEVPSAAEAEVEVASTSGSGHTPAANQ